MHLTKARQKKRVMPENTIPLINIVFLMLIFFLIAGTVAPPVSSKLKPPKSEELPLMPPAGNAVEILSDGTLIHRGQTLTLEEILMRFPAPVLAETGLQAQSKEGFGADGNAQDVLHILADKKLSTSKLMPVLQAFRAHGHKAIRLVTIRGGN
ncbi:MAG: biopolymer transporter ExbD [Cohaesibacter sp.]|nr:biopolymer transporter ExbD [Cohaesibacter sp.]MCV6602279.1 biopolymer transporter ExbD [Cohaesibacter sp.]